MLRHMGLVLHADAIERAAMSVIAKGETLTRDIGGTATTSEYTDAIIKALS